MTAIDNIIKWAVGKPAWFADAVRRHLSSNEEELPEKDFQEVLAIAEAEMGLAEEKTACLPVLPTADMFSGMKTPTAKVALEAVEAVANVNVIKNGQAINFAQTGLTVIYGSNGAGKSGFTRILKNACRARDKERVLPNVFDNPSAVPSATIKLQVNGVPVPFPWKQGETPDPLLAHVTVFDARCARVIIDDQNAPTYLPYGADVFPRVAQTAKKVRAAIEGNMVKLDPLQDSAVGAATSAGVFLSKIDHTTTQEALELATSWQAADEQALKDTEELVRASDSERMSGELIRLGKVRGRLQSARAKARELADAMSNLSHEVAQSRYDELAAAQSAFDLAVSERKTTEPLPGSASTNAWEILYNAAKEFSESSAYPGVEFPNTEDGALCVLCQQPLAEEAKERMKRFRRFIADKTAETLRQRKQALKTFSETVDALELADQATLDVVYEDLAPFSTEAHAALRKFHEAVAARKQAARQTLASQAAASTKIEWPEVPVAPLDLIDAAVSALIERVAQVMAASKPEEAKALLRKLEELKSRKALNTRKGDIETYIKTLKRNDVLRRAAASITTNDISIQGKALIKESLTPALTSALLSEQEALSAGHIKLSMRPAGSVGETTHEMLIDGLPSGVKVKLSQVLSEGEQRVIAIAGFFAELSTAQHGNPVVFDDPVSSLDHEFTGHVAMRLAKVGLARQVIVFSHDIAFLMELQDAVEELGKAGTPVALSVQTLRKLGSDAGIGSAGFPWNAQKVRERVASLEAELRAITPLHVSDREAYNEAAANLYGRLREAWEACIEDDLFDAVVCRYRNSVKAGVLMGVAVEDDDVLAIDRNYSKCSKWMRGHDKSKALTVNRPAPAEIQADLEQLRQESRKLRRRIDATKKERESKLGGNQQLS